MSTYRLSANDSDRAELDPARGSASKGDQVVATDELAYGVAPSICYRDRNVTRQAHDAMIALGCDIASAVDEVRRRTSARSYQRRWAHRRLCRGAAMHLAAGAPGLRTAIATPPP